MVFLGGKNTFSEVLGPLEKWFLFILNSQGLLQTRLGVAPLELIDLIWSLKAEVQVYDLPLAQKRFAPKTPKMLKWFGGHLKFFYPNPLAFLALIFFTPSLDHQVGHLPLSQQLDGLSAGPWFCVPKQISESTLWGPWFCIPFPKKILVFQSPKGVQ